MTSALPASAEPIAQTLLTVDTLSITNIDMTWLLAVAALTTLISLLEAWLATWIVYGKSTLLKKCFPATHNLIKSHIDYLMMTFLLGVIYFSCVHLGIALPPVIIVLLCVGALYNPFGFIVKAINPKAGSNLDALGKLGLYLGFIPMTIGSGYPMLAILYRLVVG